MSSGGEKRGQKRSKAFYRKSAYGGGKRSRGGANVLEPGIRGFLVMCNSNEGSAVKESYNILNEYADLLYGQEKAAGSSEKNVTSGEEDSECEDVEKALKKEVDAIKNTASTQKRFQNVQTKAKNCVFIRTTIDDPVKMVVRLMEDIAEKGLKKARYAARMLPIIGTCKAHTSDIEKLAKDVLQPIFCKDNIDAPSSYTVLFKIRNNNANTCGKTSVIPAVTKAVSEINPAVKFSWTDFDVALLVEVVCTVCCLGLAPAYTRLRKYNLQELQQGPKVKAEAAADLGDAELRKPEENEQHVNIKPEENEQSVNINPEENEHSVNIKPEENEQRVNIKLEANESEQCVIKPEKNEQHETCVVNPLPNVVIESAEKCHSADEVISDIKNFLPQEANSVIVCDDNIDGRQSGEAVLEPVCLQSESIPASISTAAVDVTLNSQDVKEAL